MQEIYELTGTDLASLLRLLNRPDIWDLKVAIDGGLKIKVNGGCWTPPMGTALEGRHGHRESARIAGGRSITAEQELAILLRPLGPSDGVR